MNQKKQAIWNNAKRLIRISNRVENVVRFSPSESFEHFLLKCKMCYNLKKANINFITEAIFKDGSGRADIYTERKIAYEICVTEEEKSIAKKKEVYPNGVIVMPVTEKTIDLIFNNLELKN